MTVNQFMVINKRRASILGHTSFFESPLRVACGTIIMNRELIYDKYFVTSELISDSDRMLTVHTANTASGMVGVLSCSMMHKTFKEAIDAIRKTEFKHTK